MKNKKNQKSEIHKSPLLDELIGTISDKEQQDIDRKMQLAARIYDVMTAKGWKQKDLAAAMGKEQAEISRLLSGTQNPSATTLWAVGDALNINLLPVMEEPVKTKTVYEPIFITEKATAALAEHTYMDEYEESSQINSRKIYVKIGSITYPLPHEYA